MMNVNDLNSVIRSIGLGGWMSKANSIFPPTSFFRVLLIKTPALILFISSKVHYANAAIPKKPLARPNLSHSKLIEEGNYRCQDRTNKGRLTGCEYTLQKLNKQGSELLLLMEGAGCIARQLDLTVTPQDKSHYVNDTFGAQLEVKEKGYFTFRSSAGPISQICSKEQGMRERSSLSRQKQFRYDGPSNNSNENSSDHSNSPKSRSPNPQTAGPGGGYLEDSFGGFPGDTGDGDWGFPEFQEFPYNDDQSFDF